jgi:hypothetical protein
MRTFVRLGTTAITALVLAAPLAAQPNGRHQQEARDRNDRGRENGWMGSGGESRSDDRGRADDRRRGDERDAMDLRGRAGNRWREEQEGVVRSYFAGSRRVAASRRAMVRFPHAWDNRLYVMGYFPTAYDFYREPLPRELERALDLPGRGYDRFIFGGQLIVIDRFTRTIVLAIRI